MTKDKNLDVFALAKEVNRESKSGIFTKALLANGHTLYGINPEFPDLLERMTPDRPTSIGQFKHGQFHPQFSLLNDIT